MRQGLNRFSRESDTSDVVESPEELAAVIEDTEAAAADAAVGSEQDMQVAGDVDGVNDGGDDLVVAYDVASSDDDMTPGAAVAVESLINSAAKRMGLKGDVVLGSRNAFESASSRRTHSRLARESIIDKIVEAWKAMINWVKGMYKKVREWIRGLFKSSDSLKKRAEAAKDKIGKVKGDKPKTPTFDDKHVAETFFGTSGTSSAATVLKAVTDLNTDVQKLSSFAAAFTSLSTGASDIAKEIEKAGKKDGDADKDMKSEELAKRAHAVAEKFSASVKTMFGAITPAGSAGDKTPVAAIKITASKKLQVFVTNGGYPVFSSGMYDGGSKNSNASCPAGDKATCEKICDEVKTLAGKEKDGDEEAKKLDKAEGEILKVIDAGLAAAKKLDGDAGKDAVKEMNGLRAMVTGASQTFQSVLGQLSSARFALGKAACTYVERSASCYDKKD